MSEAIPSWVRPGAKVVCVRKGGTEGLNSALGVRYPVVGETYTIRESIWHPTFDKPGIRLAEIVNPRIVYKVGGHMEAVWDLARFRPLVSQSDDIATHFAHLLDTRAPELV